MDRWDVMALAGVVLVGVGVGFVYWPLALIVPGVLLIALGVAGARTVPAEEEEGQGRQADAPKR